LAFSIHELAVILGDQLTAADLVPIFNGFLKDLDEVRIGVLKHLYDFLKVSPCSQHCTDNVPLKRKKSTGGLFLGMDQFSKELLTFVTVSVTEVDKLAVFGTKWIFFGLPTKKRAKRRWGVKINIKMTVFKGKL